MSRAIIAPTLDQALQVARDVGACEHCDGRGSVVARHCGGRTCEGASWPERTPGQRVCCCECSMCDPLCRKCGTTGVVGELSPDVVTWLAKLALHHPQVSAAVAAALPSSGVRWVRPWAAGDRRAAVGITSLLGRVMETRSGAYVWESLVSGDAGDSPTAVGAMAEVDERLLADRWVLQGHVYRRAAVPAGWDPVARVTVRPCVDCGGRVEGGPTRCTRCVAEMGGP
jgi:hypothetical protein